jgi:hypothetical protein
VTVTGHLSIEGLLEEHSPEVAELARHVIVLIRSVIPDATERVYPGWHGIGFHHPTAGYVCAVFPATDHLRVGFEHGHLLADPAGVFDPGGRKVRYITVRDLTADLAARIAGFVDKAVHVQDR